MRHIYIKTKVKQDIQQIFKGFDIQLFEALKPPFTPLKVLRFDGCKEGDEVHLQLAFRQKWVSVIKEMKQTENVIYFIDEGVKLPFFLKSWQHKHLMVQEKEGNFIIDDIQYEANSTLLAPILHPILYYQFYSRIKVYQRFFG